MRIRTVPIDRKTSHAFSVVDTGAEGQHWMLAVADDCGALGLRPIEIHPFGQDGDTLLAWALVVATSAHRDTTIMPDPLQEAALIHRREISDADWTRDITEYLQAAYLSSDNPFAQSGKGGGSAEWEAGRRVIAEAVSGPGTFLDTGCANGLLMESMAAWAGVEPYGLDISKPLVHLARKRLPHWGDRLWVGDARTWQPPRTFDYVYVLPDITRPHLRQEMIGHLLAEAVNPDGRLIVGQYLSSSNDDLDTAPIWDQLTAMGYQVAGTALKLRTPDPQGSRTEIAWITR